MHAAAALTPGATPRLELSCGSGDEADSGSWTFLKKKQCEARVFPRVLMSEGPRVFDKGKCTFRQTSLLCVCVCTALQTEASGCNREACPAVKQCEARVFPRVLMSEGPRGKVGREVSDRQGRGDGAGDVVFVQNPRRA